MRAGTICLALHGRILRETDKAIQITVTNPDTNEPKTEWFPLSQITSIHRLYDEVNDTLDILMASEWILGQKNMKHLASATKPVLSGTATKTVPSIADKLTHPPTFSWADMDGDIPF